MAGAVSWTATFSRNGLVAHVVIVMERSQSRQRAFGDGNGGRFGFANGNTNGGSTRKWPSPSAKKIGDNQDVNMEKTAKQLAGLIMEADLPQRALERVAQLEAMDWRQHIKAAMIDLRNRDRSPFEQRAYDVLRSFSDEHC